jgi:hypothetical protein
MPLQRGVKRLEMERLIEYVDSADGASTVDKRSIGKGSDHYDGYVARQRICFEQRRCLITGHRRHAEVHNDKIGTGRVLALVLQWSSKSLCFSLAMVIRLRDRSMTQQSDWSDKLEHLLADARIPKDQYTTIENEST